MRHGRCRPTSCASSSRSSSCSTARGSSRPDSSGSRRDRRRRDGESLRGAARSTQIQVGAAVAGAVVVGLVIWLVGTILDVPSVGLFALFGAAVSVVPYVGDPRRLAAGGRSSASVWRRRGRWVCVALVAVGLQYLEATRWRPFVDGRSLYVGPAHSRSSARCSATPSTASAASSSPSRC